MFICTKITLKYFSLDKKQLATLINNVNCFYAHLSKDENKKETLIEHSMLTQDYFFGLIDTYNLELIINNLVNSISDDETIKNFIKEIFVKVILLHDFGKVNPEFQNNKMKNNVNEFEHNLSSDHSIISAYIFIHYGETIAKEKYKITKEKEQLIDFLLVVFSYPILKHHSSYLDSLESLENLRNSIEDLKKFKDYFSFIKDDDFFSEINEYVIGKIDKIIKNDNALNRIKDPFALFLLIKFSYSLLTASDYYATTHFMNEIGDKFIDDFGIINDDLKKKIIKNIKETKNYNKKIYKTLRNYKLKFPKEENNKNLNKLRQNLSYEVITNIRGNLDKNLFYIEAPTGGGKTNLSLLAISELLKKHDIKKIFYVFPFTTLITQTFGTIKNTFRLDANEIIQIHSKTGFEPREDSYGKDWKNIIDYQFINYPIILLSHVKFFDILKSNEKAPNYILHTLANSVVIIDELQSYSPDVWDKLILFIHKFSEYFNIKFILMSATLPKIDKLLSKEAITNLKEVEFVNLIKDKSKYFNNPNFKNRVKFDFSMLNLSETTLENIKEKLLEESEKYKNKNNKVHTIIEFIYKKTASEFYNLLKNQNQSVFDEIFLLSGTILEPRRKEIIEKLKSEEYKNKSILLITTQVVEAGVDIDMDIGFKDTSIVDSDEQLAGRINRNISKKGSTLFLFNYNDARIIYGNEDRLQTNQENGYLDILKNKNFDLLYNNVMNRKNEHNRQIGYVDNLREFFKKIKSLNFGEIDRDFQIINNSLKSISIFIPIKIPITIKIDNGEIQIFSNEQIEFLKRYGKYENGNFIDGEKVWELYEEIIENKKQDFIKKKLNLIFLQGMMSQFVISAPLYSNYTQTIIQFLESRYGFYYLHNVEGYYDFLKGFIYDNFDTVFII